MAARKNAVGSAAESAGFETSLERLEKIVDEMENGSLSLEKMMDHFEEGQKLIRFCTGKLNGVEKKIEQLVKKGELLATEPFESDDEEPVAEPDASANADADSDELF